MVFKSPKRQKEFLNNWEHPMDSISGKSSLGEICFGGKQAGMGFVFKTKSSTGGVF